MMRNVNLKTRYSPTSIRFCLRGTGHWILFNALALAAFGAAEAAPLDALLTASPERDVKNGYVELALDNMAAISGDSGNDYHGGHVRGGFAPSPVWWLSAALWQRSVVSGGDNFRYDSWQLAAQYRVSEGDGWRPALGLRVSAWGDQASASNSSTPVSVPYLKLNTVSVTNPADQNLQVDVLSTWVLSSTRDVSVLLGGGSTQLSYGTLTASTTSGGCNYQLQFIGDTIFGTLANQCNAGVGVIQQFYASSASYGIQPSEELGWHGNFVHLGANTSWRNGPWKWSAGLLWTQVQRSGVDDILATRGQVAYTQNTDALVQGQYRLSEHLQATGSLQVSSNLFLSDIPVTYNSSTAKRFESNYSLVSIGLLYDF